MAATETVTVRMPPQLKAQLQALAQQETRSLNQQIIRACEQAVKNGDLRPRGA